MDYVIPVRDDMENESLRYVLRSLVNVDHDQVVLVGHKPDWVSHRVIHLPTTQREGKHHNIGVNMLAALSAELSDPFIWGQDDTFHLMRAPVKVLARLRTLGEHCAGLKTYAATTPTLLDHNNYVAGMLAQQRVLEGWGVDTNQLPNVDNHHPLPVLRWRMAVTFEQVLGEYPDHPKSHFKAIYGAGLQSRRVADCKITMPGRSIPAEWVNVSTSPVSWKGRAGREIRARFPTPSIYES